MSLRVYYEVLNQKGSPALFTDTFANRPAFGFQGRLFISTDTAQIFEDTGTAWTLIADAGTGTFGTLQQVTTNGNTTTLGITVQGININDGAGTGANNVAIGNNALNVNTTGSANTALGYVSLNVNTTGIQNTGVGYNSLFSNTIGNQNTAIGTSALSSNISGSNNTGIGQGALQSNTTGSNTAVGSAALSNNTTGSANTAIGLSALTNNTTADNNTAIGSASLFTNTTGTNNTAIGYQSLLLTTGGNNIAIGSNAGSSITTGSNNTIIGNYQGTTTLANNIVLADGSGNIRYQFDGTNNVFGANVIAPQVRASTSAGLSINANSGTQVADFGAGGSANLTLYGGLSGTTATFSNVVSAIADSNANAFIARARTADDLAQIRFQNNNGSNSNALISVTKIGTNGGKIDFLTKPDGLPLANALTLASSGNVIVGGTTDAGFRFDCVGTARVQGQLTLSNGITLSTSGSGLSGASSSVVIASYAGSAASNGFIWSLNNNYNNIIGTRNLFSIGDASFSQINQASNNGIVNWLSIYPVINGTGGTLTSRGIYYNPTLTSLTGVTHRAIETTTGDVLLGTTSGSVGIGVNTSINASAIVDITSTTKGFLPPRMTTSQKNAISSPATGLVVFDTDLGKLCVFATTWETITSI
jgi:hypothetical protein